MVIGLFWTLLAGCDGDGGAVDDGGVVINELLAGNVTGLTDEAGSHPDWVELFNGGEDDVDLIGWTLTDDPGVDVPWMFSDEAIVPAGGYLVVFCDGDVDDGPLHTDFKLSGDGETLVFVRPDGATQDEIAFPVQPVDDVSYGRLTDGGEAWGALDAPSPGASNAP